MNDIKVGDILTFAGRYHRRSFVERITRKPKRLVRYTVTDDSMKLGGLVLGDKAMSPLYEDQPQIDDTTLGLLLDATIKLTSMRQDQCNHLCIENAASSIFAKLVDTYNGMRN